MEWGSAKKFVLVLLLALNICLAFLNLHQTQETAMTSAQEKAIFEVLSQNGITIYTELQTEYDPMPRLICHPPTYTKEELEQLFFAGEKTTVTPGKKTTVYRSSSARLTLSSFGGEIVYQENSVAPENLTQTNLTQTNLTQTSLTQAQAVKAAETYIKQLQPTFGDMTAYGVYPTQEGYRVEFFGIYEDTPVFSNCFQVEVSALGVSRVSFSYCPVETISSERKDVYFADEALLTFLREVQKMDFAESITIERMELGYDISAKTQDDTAELIYAIPCYRIYIMEQEEPFIINAYTCQMVSNGNLGNSDNSGDPALIQNDSQDTKNAQNAQDMVANTTAKE